MNSRLRTARHGTVVIGVNWLGDTVMSLPALVALREMLPDEPIHVFSPGWLANLIRLATPIDAALGWSPAESTITKVRNIRVGRYRRAIIFPNSFRWASIAWLSGIPERWGYTGQMRGWLLHPAVHGSVRPKGAHQSQHYLELIRQMGWRGYGFPRVTFRIPSSSRQWVHRVLGPEAQLKRIVGVCPGATYGPAKRWDPECFIEVAKGLRDRHGVRILLLGDEREAPVIREMAEKIGDGAWDLSGRTDLERLAALLAICHVVISNDSGPMHLASALGTPVVALFGSTDPDATAPIGPHRIVQAQVDCAPCLRRECPKNTYRCLREIVPDAVLLAAEDLLLGSAAARGPVS